MVDAFVHIKTNLIIRMIAFLNYTFLVLQDELLQVEKSRTEHTGLSVNRDLEKVEHM